MLGVPARSSEEGNIPLEASATTSCGTTLLKYRFGCEHERKNDGKTCPVRREVYFQEEIASNDFELAGHRVSADLRFDGVIHDELDGVFDKLVKRRY